jgi:hypothetical protein
MTTTTDYYALLGVQPDAALAQIKKAYRKLARQHHPTPTPATRRPPPDSGTSPKPTKLSPTPTAAKPTTEPGPRPGLRAASSPNPTPTAAPPASWSRYSKTPGSLSAAATRRSRPW